MNRNVAGHAVHAHEVWWVVLGWAVLWTAMLLFPISSYDIWWQLDSGRWMLENGRVLREEIRSVVDAGTPWTNFTWLFQVLVAATYEIGGFWALLGLKGLMWCLLLLVSAIASIRHRHALLPWMVVTLGLASTVTIFMLLRPHLLAAICLLTAVVLLHRPVNRGTLGAWALLLVFWANVHASVVVGVAAMGLHLVLLPGLGGLRPKPLRNLLLAALLGCAAFVTPNGLDLVRVLLDHAGSDIVQRYISEWQTISFPPATRLVVALGVFGLLRHWRRLSWGEVFLLAFFSYMASKNVRFLFELCLISIRPAVQLLCDGWEVLASQRAWQRRLFAIVSLAAVFAVAELPARLSARATAVFPVDQSKYPYATVSMANSIADRLGRPVRVFNAYGLGGFLQWAGKGKVETFIDGRTPTIYPEQRLMEHQLGFAQTGVIDLLDERYGFDALVLNRHAIGKKLLRSGNWRLVGFDEASSFYVKESLAESLELPPIGFNPSKLDMPDDVAELEERLRELRSLLRWDDGNFLAHVQLGLTILKLAELSDVSPDEGVMALEKALALRPKHTVVHFLLGRALWQSGQDKERALHHLDIALTGGGGQLRSPRLSELADIYLAAHQPAKALEALDSIRGKAQALDRRSHAWLVRATAQAALGQGGSAAQSLYFAKLLAHVREEDICAEVAAIERLMPEAEWDATSCRPSPASAAGSATPEN